MGIIGFIYPVVTIQASIYRFFGKSGTF